MKYKKLVTFIMFLAMSGAAIADLNTGLVAYYPFNGNANDESGNGNNGTVYGAILTTDRLGNPNSAYSFDGVDNYILIPQSQSLNLFPNWTICLWGVINSNNDGSMIDRVWNGNNVNQIHDVISLGKDCAYYNWQGQQSAPSWEYITFPMMLCS